MVCAGRGQQALTQQQLLDLSDILAMLDAGPHHVFTLRQLPVFFREPIHSISAYGHREGPAARTLPVDDFLKSLALRPAVPTSYP